MTDIERLEIAKDTYYNSGIEIMSDFEYDELEQKIGLENKSHIGTLHNESYTIKHPIIMGSLSKVQVKENKDTKITNYTDFAEQALKYINYYNKDEKTVIITPKYDGCSFELVLNNRHNRYDANSNIVSCSTRGDGEYGKDMLYKLKDKFDIHFISSVFKSITSVYGNINGKNIILRGECLVKKSVFESKYKNTFVNPRAFVAGTLNADYDITDKELLERLSDIDCIIYDVRIEEDKNSYKEIDFEIIRNELRDIDYKKYYHIFPGTNVVTYDSSNTLINNFAIIYNKYNHIRSNYEYALDGFVIKPTSKYRKSNNTESRPKDCIAIKFKPMIESTTVKDIEWSVGKGGELTPVLILNEIKLDGKSITRVSAHNYGYIKDNNIKKNTKVDISLAGDIIPFIYNIYKEENEEANHDVSFSDYDKDQIRIDGVHAYLIENEQQKMKRLFIQRSLSLAIKSLGKKNAEKLANYIYNNEQLQVQSTNNDKTNIDDFFNNETIKNVDNDYSNNVLNNTITYYSHILLVPFNIIEEAIGGKTADTIIKNIQNIVSKISFKELIKSCCFLDCGSRVSEECAKYLIDEQVDWFGLNKDAYSWVFNKESEEFKLLESVMNYIGKDITYYKSLHAINNTNNNQNKTFVILTGEPNNYNSKNDFLQHHPEYELTGSWKKVQIVFTNDINSNTGKMKQARAKSIEIRLY